MKAARCCAVLHDSPGFGGHERAFMAWLPAVLASPRIDQVHVFAPLENTTFLSELSRFESTKLHVEPSNYVKAAAEPLRAPFRFAFGLAAATFVAERRADLVLMLQGRIENLATPMLWLPRRLEVVSYLPMAHSAVEMGKSAALAGAIDALKRPYYRRPQRFIVPSQAVAAQSRRAGAVAPIYVVENVAPLSLTSRARTELRLALDLPQDRRLALFMGRFDAHQKGLDHLLRDLRLERARLSGWYFVFVGEGPAADDIRAVLGDDGVGGRVIDWTAEPQSYLAASDIVVAPSRYEGVPLIMLEAMQQRVPILASNIDVYREYLQPQAIRDFAQPVDLPAALDALTTPEAIGAFTRHAEAVMRRLDITTSQKDFVAALVGEDASASLA